MKIESTSKYVLSVDDNELKLIKQGLLALSWEEEDGWPAASQLNDEISSHVPDMETDDWDGEAIKR